MEQEPYKDIKQPVRVIKRNGANEKVSTGRNSINTTSNKNHPPQTLPDGRTRNSSTGGSKRRRYASTKGYSDLS